MDIEQIKAIRLQIFQTCQTSANQIYEKCMFENKLKKEEAWPCHIEKHQELIFCLHQEKNKHNWSELEKKLSS